MQKWTTLNMPLAGSTGKQHWPFFPNILQVSPRAIILHMSSSVTVVNTSDTVIRDVASPIALSRFPLLSKSASILHFIALLPLIVLLNLINFGQSGDVAIIEMFVTSPTTSFTLGVDLGDFYDWYSECVNFFRFRRLPTSPSLMCTC